MPAARPFLLLLLMALPLSCAAPADEYEARIFKTANGEKLRYRLLIPRNYDAAQKYPLVLFLHGAGERGSDNAAQLTHCASTFTRPENREKYPCFVVVPQCPKDQKWVDIDWQVRDLVQPPEVSAPMRLTLSLLDALAKEFTIDQDRVAITGISMGGFGTWDVLTRFPECWAAAVPVCGGGESRKAARAARVPVWCFHGDADQVIKVERSRAMIAALQEAGGNPKYTEYPGVAHDSWTPAFAEPDLLPWLFAQRKKVP